MPPLDWMPWAAAPTWPPTNPSARHCL